MKTFSKILAVFFASSLLAAGCVNEDPAYKNDQTGGGTDEPAGTEGYLAGIAALRVVADTQTDIQPDDTADETQNPSGQSLHATRAEGGATDTSGYIVEIFDADGTSQIGPTTYAELQAQLAVEPLKLPVGTYRIDIWSEPKAAVQPVAWDHPVYGGSYAFTILKDQTTTIDEVVCTLQSIKVTLACSIDLLEQLSDQTTATVTLGSVEALFEKGETAAAYFMPQEGVTKLDFLMEGTFVEGAKVRVQKQIDNVKAGQWRKISLVITYADQGNIKIGVEVENFVLDDEITVNGSANLWEAVLDDDPDIDPTAPTISWPGHELTEPFRLTDEMFDSDGKCTEPFAFDVESSNGIESMIVDIASTNDAFVQSLKTLLQLDVPSFDLCALDPAQPAYVVLKAFGFPLGDKIKGRQHTSFDIAGQMPLLYNDPGFDGTHTFSFTIFDAAGLSTKGSLVLVVDRNSESEAPTIVWKEHDIDQQFELTADTQINVEFTAPAGIRSLVVTIISETLTPEELGNVGLPDTFDLADITDPDLARTLGDPDPAGFGFPINEKVKDQTAVPFCITPFVKLLVAFEGLHKFRLDVTDNNGKTVTKTVQLNVTLPQE